MLYFDKDQSIYRKMFIYFREILDLNNNTVNIEMIKPHHIFLIHYSFFGIRRKFSNYKKVDEERKEINNRESQLLNEYLPKIKNQKCMIIHDLHKTTFTYGIKSVVDKCKEFNIDFILTYYKIIHNGKVLSSFAKRKSQIQS